MGRLNHQRPILQLIDARKRGLAVVGISASALGKRYLTPVASSTARAKKEPSEKEKLHIVAIAIVDHFVSNGDLTDANRLLELAKPGAEREALQEWFLRYGGMGINRSTGRFRKARKLPPDRAGGLANPYWTLKEPAKRRAFDLGVELSGFVSKARERKRAELEGDNINDSLLGDLESMLREHGIGFD